MVSRTSNGSGEDVSDLASAKAQLLRDHVATQPAAETAMAALQRALATTESRLGAALRELERSRRLEALRAQELQQLTEAAGKAQRSAYHDELTGLPNHHLLKDRFEQAVARAARYDLGVALLFLDMDGFKHVNNTLGHSAGDRLLQQVAARLVGRVRASDTVCRYGEDEFVLLLPELREREGAVVVARNIRTHFTEPYIIDGNAVTLTTSLGIAVHPIDADNYSDLLRFSSLAMRRDKARQPATPGICDPASHTGTHSGRLLSLLRSDD